MFHPIRRLKRFLWFKLMERMHLDWSLRSGTRLMIRSYADWCSFNEIFANDEYTLPIRETLNGGKRPLHILDLGANFGYFGLRIADQHFENRGTDELTLWMVEASPDVSAELRRRMGCSKSRMKWFVTQGLVGKRSGAARLNYAVEDNQNFVNESGQQDSWKQTGGSDEIRYVDVAEMVKEAAVIDLIKCDIEGSEYDFLRSYPDLLKKTTRMVIEFHSAFGDIAEATRMVTNSGFTRVAVLREDSQTPVVYFSRT